MAADTPTAELPASSAKSKKSKKKRSKTTASKPNGEVAKTNGAEADHDQEEDAVDDESDTQPVAADETPSKAAPAVLQEIDAPSLEAIEEEIPPSQNGLSSGHASNIKQDTGTSGGARSSDATSRLETAARERDQLRTEVTELRKSIESIQQKHEDDIAKLNGQLEETQTGKEHAEGRYQKLLGQVNTIKKQLGERLKADAEDLSQARAQIEQFEERGRTYRVENESLQAKVSEIHAAKEQQEQEISSLRERTNLSQKKWAKERDDLLSREAQVREEFEVARQAMQDWEVLAMEARSDQDRLTERVAELEDQLSNQLEAYERAASERDTQSTTVDGLQRALQEIQEARKQELREVVENSQAQLEELRSLLKTAEELASSSKAELATTKQELERALPFEKEVKEKNLLIGKLRHEAVILNDHLTKALRFLKRGKPEDNVDRQLVTNHLLHFLSFDRADPKKYQILQLISALLGWTEEQQETAGLVRQGASQPINPAQHSSLRIPLSPFRRASSSSNLSGQRSPSASMNLNNIFTSPTSSSFDPNANGSPMSGNRSESLAELWSGFLEREALEGSFNSRRTSVSTTAAGTPVRPSNRGREMSGEVNIAESGGED